ncbi:PH domain-containing protein [Nonlabens sp. Ci31]|jgi:putative membrane protein|uniref:PH domain-containing protein n=1 Tax=Nonlabens sp. Ci31 TaxID=2608253 RepID=UPI001463D5A3|nr:PH domain-containing protein [Nonlabens sp. Ci31]QJP35107.1 PH domain-containing protein [Nonlabens sp. Ci31]
MLDLSTPQRQSKKIIIFYLFKSIKGLILYFLFAAIGTKSMGEYGWYMTAFIAFIAVLSLLSPVVKYIYFTFHIEDDELIIQKGLLQKERKAIPLERIQSININQNVVQRILGIVSLEVDTAGSKAKELEIPGLERAFASQFKDLLQERKEEIVEGVSETATNESFTTQDASGNNLEVETGENTAVSKAKTSKKAVEDTTETMILQLGIIDILKVGITQNHLKSAGLAIGVAFGSWYKIKDLVEEYFEEWLQQFSFENVISGTSLGLAFAAVISFLFFSVVISMLLAINKYWDFSIVKKGTDLEVKMGLFNKKEIKIPLSKVQILEFHSNPLRKLLGFQTAQIFQAQSTDNKLGSVSVPACKEVHRVLLQHLIFKQPVEETEQELHCNPYSHARLRFYISSVFAIPLIGAAIYFEEYAGVVLVIAISFFLVFAAFMYGKNSKVIRDDDFVVFKKGWIFPQTIISPVFKTQAVEKWRSVFLKRRKEAHFRLHTAAGTRGLRYLKESALNKLINAINNEVICSEEKWM